MQEITVTIGLNEDKNGKKTDRICNVARQVCRNEGNVCNCSVYSGNDELPNLFKL